MNVNRENIFRIYPFFPLYHYFAIIILVLWYSISMKIAFGLLLDYTQFLKAVTKLPAILGTTWLRIADKLFALRGIYYYIV